jgi:hypothetical protein
MEGVWTNAQGSTKIAERFLGDANASIRSEAEDERPSPAASNPTLSAMRTAQPLFG